MSAANVVIMIGRNRTEHASTIATAGVVPFSPCCVPKKACAMPLKRGVMVAGRMAAASVFTRLVDA